MVGGIEETEAIRKGLTQIRDWKRWIDKNKEYFYQSHELNGIRSYINPYGFLYCLVASRRDRMDRISNEMRGQLSYGDPHIKVITYDRLAENI